LLSPETTRAFQGAIRETHGAESIYVESVPVHEAFQGQTVWEGIVHVFDLQGHPKATRAYAWADLMDELGPRHQFTVILKLPPVETPEDAVRVAILHRYRQDHPRS
jgi:hypothetical protein